MKISIDITVEASVDAVWDSWTSPDQIVKWNVASDDWCCPTAINELKVGGSFSYRMEAKDKSMGFDFGGKYTRIDTHKLIEFELEDKRTVQVHFSNCGSQTKIEEIFEVEDENSAEGQRQGWLCILGNFKKHVESLES